MRRVLVTVAVLLVALTPSAAGAADTADDPSVPHACAEALALVDAGRPRDALTLIEEYRENVSPAGATSEASCADAYGSAVAARETARAVSLQARALQPGGEKPVPRLPESWAAAGARAEQALALDEQNTLAAKVLRASQQTPPVDRAAQAWSGFVETVKPLGAPLLALVVGVLVLTVLARSVVPTTLRWPVLTAGQRAIVTVTGWVALGVGGALLVWGPATVTTPWPDDAGRVSGAAVGVLGAVAVAAGAAALALACATAATGSADARTRWWMWTTGATGLVTVVLGVLSPGMPALLGALLPGAAAAGLGVLLVGTVFATRLRLAVEVTSGAGDRATSGDGTGGAHLVALLGELGAEPPRGLEVPRGTDISALSGSALAELPQGAFVKAIVSLAQGVLGSVPWRVTVEEKDPDHLAVVVARNGRAAGSAAIGRRDLLRFDPADPASVAAAGTVDLYRAAAAVILMTLSRHHAGFDGLCGATSWRGLALQYIAQSDLAADPARRTQLLARAVDLDPANDLAQLALANDTARYRTVREDLVAYRRWLDDFVARSDGRSGYRSLRLRALYSRAVTAVNACFAESRVTKRASGRMDDDAVDAVRTLLEALGAERRAGREDALVAGLQDAADSMYYQAEPAAAPSAHDALVNAYRDAVGEPTDGLAEVGRRTTTPTGEYNLACTYAIQRPLRGADVRSATDHLRRAADLSALRAWLHEDPMLTAYRGRQEYLDEFGTDPAGLLDVEPFARHADALRAVGLTTTGRILARRPPALTTDLATTPEVAAELRAAAHLVEDVPDARGCFDVADVLLSRGVKAVGPTNPELPAEVVTAVRSRIGRTRLDPTDRERWTTWLGRA